MALIEIPGREALHHLRQNKAAKWGNRLADNRVEPIAAPVFDVPFHLHPGAPIFTIGSCFARNVESELIRRGFEVPMRRLFNTPEFEDLEPQIVNNFGTPSIYNEIAWAFGEMPFDENTAYLKMRDDRYVDLHMIASLRPTSLKVLQARREGLFKATRTLADCSAMIMTLGLVELWWDEEAGLYLNTQPPRIVQRKYPDRFSLHVLGMEECIDHLERALEIIFRYAKPDMHIILTVSPVPMSATYRPSDVMTANSYSKSLLRVVSEYIVTNYEKVSYFPSYETITISDRNLAWRDDFVHVRREMVAFNVERMVDAFSDRRHRNLIKKPSDAKASSNIVEESFLAARARQARMADDTSFFTERTDDEKLPLQVAWEYAQFFFDRKDYESALPHLADNLQPKAKLLAAQCMIATQNYEKAISVVSDLCRSGQKDNLPWRLWVQALSRSKAPLKELETVEGKWLSATFAAQPIIALYCGIAMRDCGHVEAALARLTIAADDHRATVAATLHYEECLRLAGKPAQALDVLRAFTSEDAQEMDAVRKRLDLIATA